jgi:hypothetical protein
MRIDLPSPDSWSKLCDRYRASLRKHDPAFAEAVGPVYAFDNAQHGLFEITRGLAKLFSHKKTVAIASGQDPMFDSIAVALSEEGYQVKALSADDLKSPETVLAELMNELLFVLVAEDDAMTGKLFDVAPLQAALKDKRVFRIVVSHASFRARAQRKPEFYEVRILSCRPDRALVLAGDRCRIEPSVAPLLSWPNDSDATIDADIAALGEGRLTELESSVLAFEADLPAGFETYFEDSDERFFDRSAVYHPEFDGYAVASELAKEVGWGAVDSTSPCRWESPRLAEWLMRRGESEEKIRGLVMIDANVIDDSFAQKLDRIATKLRTMQNG